MTSKPSVSLPKTGLIDIDERQDTSGKKMLNLSL
jgi:hypothetical protein